MTRPTQHQLIIMRLEREQERLQSLLEHGGLEVADISELEEIAADLTHLEDKSKTVRERIEALVAKLKEDRP